MRTRPIDRVGPARGTAGSALATAIVVLTAGGAWQARAVETGGYQAPDIGKFLLISDEHADGDADGVKETHILRYQDVAGDRIFSMTAKGRLWAWSLEASSGKGAEGDWNYVIRDSNCDGTYDEKYSLDDEFQVPDCLK